MWLSPLIKEINQQDGTVIGTFMATGKNIISIEGVTDDLKLRVSQQLRRFETLS